ncbi:MAG: hypothetical protein ACYC3I_07115 [Gemmataceae bacterium]
MRKETDLAFISYPAFRIPHSVLCLMCLLSPLHGAEEAWRSDGRRLRGNLTLDGGQLRFQPTAGAALAPADLTRIRFPEGAPSPFRAGGGRRVYLWDSERITGQILDLNNKTLVLRTAWAKRLELPRAAVASIEPLPGWRLLLDEDFHGEPAALAAGLRLAGEPTFADVEDGTAARALLLRAAGQSLTYTPTKPLEAGRIGVNFQERAQARGARWAVELLFQHGARARRVKVTIAGDGEHYTVDAPPLFPPKLGGDKGGGTARRVARTPGWHRLIVQFGKQSLRLTCDDDVLWYNLDEGPGEPLRKVTIHCQQSPERAAVRGAVAWTEFCVERAVDEHPQPPAETEQDAVRSRDDDYLFGRILHADRRAIQMEGRFGKRALPWTMVSGCSFRRPAELPKANERANVRLLVRSGLCAESDVLEGVVTALDERRLILRHALLGELTFERGRARELRPLAAGSK